MNTNVNMLIEKMNQVTLKTNEKSPRNDEQRIEAAEKEIKNTKKATNTLL